MTDDFVLAFHAVFIVLVELEIVIGEAQKTKPYGGEKHQQHVDVAEVAHQQAWYENGGDDDDSAHCGCAFFLELAFEVEVADNFSDLPFLKTVDDAAAYEDGHEQGEHKGRA